MEQKHYRALTDISHRETGEVVKKGEVRPRDWWWHLTDFELQIVVDDLKLLEEVDNGTN